MTKSRRPPSPISSGTCSPTGPPPARRSTGDPLPRGRCARNPRAAGRRGARAHRGRGRRRSLSSARAWNGGGPARDRTQRTRRAVCDRRPDPDRQDGVRPGPARSAALRVARRGAPRLVRLPALTVLRSRPGACGLPRRTPSRPRRERPDRVVEETLKLRGQPLRMLDTPSGSRAARGGSGLARSMIRAAYGLERRRSARTRRSTCGRTEPSRTSSRSWRSGSGSGRALPRGALRRAGASDAPNCRGDEPGRVAVTDLLRARTRRTEVVFLLGLEEGSFPSPAGRLSSTRRKGARSTRLPGTRGSRSQTRSRASATSSPRAPGLRRLYLVREASTDDGSPREPSPFWDEA